MWGARMLRASVLHCSRCRPLCSTDNLAETKTEAEPDVKAPINTIDRSMCNKQSCDSENARVSGGWLCEGRAWLGSTTDQVHDNEY